MLSVAVEFLRGDGSCGSAIAGSAEEGRRLVAYYRGEGYSVVRADLIELCEECAGRGKRPHRRKQWVSVRCGTCRGKDSELFLKSLL